MSVRFDKQNYNTVKRYCQALPSEKRRKIKIGKATTEVIAFPGTAEGIRTPDLLVRSQTLYPTELQPHIN